VQTNLSNRQLGKAVASPRLVFEKKALVIVEERIHPVRTRPALTDRSKRHEFNCGRPGFGLCNVLGKLSRIYLGLSFRPRTPFFLAAVRCFLTAALERAIVVRRKLIFL
jgi:hypothetical protein